MTRVLTTGRLPVKTRSWATLAAGLAVAGVLSACAPVGTPMTQVAYDASDGVRATVGDVSVLNMMVFTEDGEDGNFVAGVTNRSEQDVELTLQYESDGDKVDVIVEVPGGATVRVGDGDFGQVLLPGIGAQPGALLKLYLQYGSEPGKLVNVPVLDDRLLPEYENLLPTPTPTPTPTETPAVDPEPTETPAP